jgi:hypothetical protein
MLEHDLIDIKRAASLLLKTCNTLKQLHEENSDLKKTLMYLVHKLGGQTVIFKKSALTVDEMIESLQTEVSEDGMELTLKLNYKGPLNQ